MTEAEWLAATDPTPMLEFLRGRASNRKLRLFGVAVARLCWDRMTEPALRAAVETAERAADGLTGAEEMAAAGKRVDDVVRGWQEQTGATTPLAAYRAVSPETRSLTVWVFLTTMPVLWLGDPDKYFYKLASEVTRPHQPPLLREVFGNPFRPVTSDPSWLTSDVRLLAQGIYQGKAFDRLPILADALQDAGCASDDLLNHCRSGGEHVRGCWALDLLLGKG
jgi:hypothetical protein